MASDELHHPAFLELTRVSARIGCLSFGGPAGQIALMHRELVEDRRWVTEEDYLQALSLCNLLPGPEAQQLATWVGWKLHGWKGGLVAGGLFVAPGALVMLGLSVLYGFASHLGWFAALMLGIKAAVLAIIAQALLRLAGRALGTPFQKGLAVAAFVGLFFFDTPFPIVVLGALAVGAAAGARKPHWLALKPGDTRMDGSGKPWIATLKAVAVWGTIWAMPMLAVAMLLGRNHVLWDIGAFFSQLAVVTFGGAYAVLAYMAQEAVSGFGWLAPREMADGLGLAETTPGPLIMVTQFVGYLAAFRAPEPFTPLVAGILGAGLTTWVTFAPCFLWIFALAPWLDYLKRARSLKGGLAAVTAAVVGVIANLALWFALHVLFARVSVTLMGPLRVQVPDLASFDWRTTVIAAMAGLLIFRLRWGVIPTLGVAGSAGLILGQLA